MKRFAPRLSPRLVSEIERLADDGLPAAEIVRRVGETASVLGLPRPSYERVRVLVRTRRERPWRATTAGVVFDVAMRVRPPMALADHLGGIGVPRNPHRT